jgi:ribosomal-protein-alanine N-acetyltransferase
MSDALVAVAEIPYAQPFPACDMFTMTSWQIGDVAAVMAASSDPAIQAFTSMPEASQESARGWITRQPGQRRDGMSVHFALRDSTGRVLGNVGLVGFEWAHRRAEVGYWVLPWFRRRGIASRALGLITRWVFDCLPVERLDLFVDLDNEASRRVAEKRGYEYEARLRSFRVYRGKRCDLDLYRHLKLITPPPPPPPEVAVDG